MSVIEIMQQAQGLSPQERKQLAMLLVESLEVSEPKPKRRISELRGLGKELWKGIDAQEYVDQLRSEWDDRP